jgi:hypothetical protein
MKIPKLLDSTVLIDLFRGNVVAAQFVNQHRQSQVPLFISVVSAMELVAGCRNRLEVTKTEQLVAEFALLYLSPRASAKAYSLMLTYSKSHGLAIADALIAATAITQPLELATHNERHFRMIPELVVKRPY